MGEERGRQVEEVGGGGRGGELGGRGDRVVRKIGEIGGGEEREVAGIWGRSERREVGKS